MSISFNKQPGQRILELGGGGNRHFQADCNVDLRKVDGVDFAADFNEPLPLKDNEWDAVYCAYTLEHVSFHKTKDFLREVCRVCKPEGKVVFILPNTENQIEWIKSNPNGWDGEDLFTSASKVLFGGQNHVGNFHSAYFDPAIIVKLLTDAGFENVQVSPYGSRSTDMVVDATKPASKVIIPPAEKTVAKHVRPVPVGVPLRDVLHAPNTALHPNVPTMVIPPIEELKPTEIRKLPLQERQEILSRASDNAVEHGLYGETKTTVTVQPKREELFDREYFNGGKKVGGYAHEGYSDFPCHWTTAKKILERNPKSVVELGACKGMVLKRIIDQGIPGCGLEISKHCYLTRVTNAVQQQDLCAETWGPFRNIPEGDTKPYDLAYSVATFEHIPEEYLPIVLNNLRNISHRGIHGIDFGEREDFFDKTHCLLRSFSWWRAKFDEFGLQSHEIVDKEQLEDQKYFPQEVFQNTTGFKINLGCGLSQFWHGWVNVDAQDLSQFSQPRGHLFLKHDIRNGLAPFATAGVDAIFLQNAIEYLTYDDAFKLLRECRRIIKADGQIRIGVVDIYAFVAGHNTEPICDLSDFDEYSEAVAKAKTKVQKLHALLYQGRQSTYDEETLTGLLVDAGFNVPNHGNNPFRWNKEVMEHSPDLNLFLTAEPRME